MTLEALSSNDLFSFLLYETLSPTPFSAAAVPNSPENDVIVRKTTTSGARQEPPPASRGIRKRRRRKPRGCKNEEEAETQRMTHIAVERNRRRQMNQHLSDLRSLMPQSYAQKGDQASIVGGAIDFIKELEHKLQSLEAQKLQLYQSNRGFPSSSSTSQDSGEAENHTQSLSQFFLHSYDPSQENKNGSRSFVRAAMADVEVTLIETHANIRILCRRRGTMLSKLVAALHSLSLSVLHLSLTTTLTCAVYSISTKVEESCQLSSGDDIAAAVHHMLSIIEEEAFCCSSMSGMPFDIS
ncbi:PREDICTED: transcription factor bHLH71 [Tarenaya hassleriana]|uniref:transcription factor bHLH71 n=1 Tax=Tarenaya hassleriana TaxID=28532 RepID=UPI00053C0A1B|nr:PREDICTED: transcription factor bHLH71 [Tarenaya hassleriana]